MTETETSLVLISTMLIMVNAFAIFLIYTLSRQLKLLSELHMTEKHYITVLEMAVSAKDAIIKSYEDRLRELGDDIPTAQEKPLSETSII